MSSVETKMRKQTKHQKQLVHARTVERQMHQMVMAVHQQLITLWFGSALPRQMEEEAIELVVGAMQKAKTMEDIKAIDVPGILAVVVARYREGK